MVYILGESIDYIDAPIMNIPKAFQLIDLHQN